eukprot:GHVU01107956.1.p1 GENE.GHVU01107956.1~~GHVU01107956.1.p1  ORF type:complete len:388 (+),score=34.96 GHVU01107956.1:350-1513(+)
MNTIKVTVLGAGREVGRSCVVVQMGGKKIMFDCGIHIGYEGASRYPDLSSLADSRGSYENCVDLVIITHFHLDHCGALPHLTERLGYRGPILMSYPTKALAPVLLADCCRVHEQRGRNAASASAAAGTPLPSSSKDDATMYTLEAVKASLSRVTSVQLKQTVDVCGIEATGYYAGHVLGACMFHVRYGADTVVYTGDFNCTPDRHLGPAEIDRLSPDVLISESTYGTHVRADSKKGAESLFCRAVHECLLAGGKVLIPVYAVGRAQELCLMLDSYWQRMGLDFPIYFAGGMTEKANNYYRLFASWTQASTALQSKNTFEFPNTLQFDWRMLREDPPGPLVLFATPAMLNTGTSLKAFRMWGSDPKNLVVLPGYCVSGTPGNKLLMGK